MKNRIITKYQNYIIEKSYKDEFLRLYENAPKNLKNLINLTKNIKQSKKWHPEGDVYTHTRLVVNRLYNCYNDINLNLAGLFHDLGKIDATKFDKDKQSWTAHGHEDLSVEILNKYKNWINEMGGDINIIEYIIGNHMRYKYLDDMRASEQIKLFNHPYFEYLQKFSSADYGGSGLICKDIPEYKDIKDKITNLEKTEKENKTISNKFNGKIIMDKYPELKGKELGDTISKFKNSFNNFREFALDHTSKEIMIEFDNFIKKYFFN